MADPLGIPHLPDALRILRGAYSQRNVATLSGVPLEDLRRYELGEALPSAGALHAILSALRVDLRDFEEALERARRDRKAQGA